MSSGTEHRLYFNPKKPLFIKCENGINGSEIEFTSMRTTVEISLGLENVKKLFIVLREYLKEDSITPFFTRDDELVLNKNHKVISRQPAAEALKELSV